MSDEVKKAICLCMFTATLAWAWCFDSHLECKAVSTQEQTKWLISLDAKNLKLAELKAGEPCAKE